MNATINCRCHDGYRHDGRKVRQRAGWPGAFISRLPPRIKREDQCSVNGSKIGAIFKVNFAISVLMRPLSTARRRHLWRHLQITRKTSDCDRDRDRPGATTKAPKFLRQFINAILKALIF